MTNLAAQLQKLNDTDLIIANPSEDIRGRTVRDANGEKIGGIDDLLIDSEDNQVRLLRVEHGGILGFGATPSFIPVGHQPDHRRRGSSPAGRREGRGFRRCVRAGSVAVVGGGLIDKSAAAR